MSILDQRKAATSPVALPKCGVTRVTRVTRSQSTDFAAENVLPGRNPVGLHGVTTPERIFEKFALRYARKGFEVFPLAPGSKKPPKGSHGLTDATNDGAQVAEWCREFPFANIAIRTGPGSGICAIDIDPLKGGFETERHLRAESKTWPETPVQRTRSGGRHVILQHHTLIVTGSNRLGPGIDFRGAGGYIVAAPSMVGDKAYSWLTWPACGPSPVPKWLLDHIADEAATRYADDQARTRTKPSVELEPEHERPQGIALHSSRRSRDLACRGHGACRIVRGRRSRSLGRLE